VHIFIKCALANSSSFFIFVKSINKLIGNKNNNVEKTLSVTTRKVYIIYIGNYHLQHVSATMGHLQVIHNLSIY